MTQETETKSNSVTECKKIWLEWLEGRSPYTEAELKIFETFKGPSERQDAQAEISRLRKERAVSYLLEKGKLDGEEQRLMKR